MYSPPLLTRIPFQLTYPSASVLNNGKHRSNIFFFGLIIATFYSVKSCSWPSSVSLSFSWPFGLSSSMTVCSSLEAQTTMPLDWKPAKGLGFKFTITRMFPLIYSRGTCCWRPDAIYRTSSNTSIFSHHNFSLSGCYDLLKYYLPALLDLSNSHIDLSEQLWSRLFILFGRLMCLFLLLLFVFFIFWVLLFRSILLRLFYFVFGDWLLWRLFFHFYWLMWKIFLLICEFFCIKEKFNYLMELFLLFYFLA